MMIAKLKKAKGTKKKCIIKRRITENYTDCLFNDKIISKPQQRFKSYITKCIQKNLIKLHQAVMMIKDYKHLISLKHTNTEQMRLKCAKVK